MELPFGDATASEQPTRPPAPFRVEVIRSPRRRRTVQARLVGDTLELRIPARLSVAEERRWAAEMTSSFERSARAAGVDLAARARRARPPLPPPGAASACAGSPTRATGGDRARRAPATSASPTGWPASRRGCSTTSSCTSSPTWPSPTTRPRSGPSWRAIPKAERARGFLIAKGLENPTAADGQPVGARLWRHSASMRPSSVTGEPAWRYSSSIPRHRFVGAEPPEQRRHAPHHPVDDHVLRRHVHRPDHVAVLPVEVEHPPERLGHELAAEGELLLQVRDVRARRVLPHPHRVEPVVGSEEPGLDRPGHHAFGVVGDDGVEHRGERLELAARSTA